MLPLMNTGMPCKGPRKTPLRRSLSLARAVARVMGLGVRLSMARRERPWVSSSWARLWYSSTNCRLEMEMSERSCDNSWAVAVKRSIELSRVVLR